MKQQPHLLVEIVPRKANIILRLLFWSLLLGFIGLLLILAITA